jgi:hypothetical protein
MTKQRLCLSLGVLLAGSLLAKDPPALVAHDWKTGTVEASAMQQEHLGTNGMDYGGFGPAMSTVREVKRTWQGLMIQGGGEFYIQDEDGKEFTMMILQKALMPAAPAAPVAK